MKRAIIVHCWDGYPEYCWYQNAKKDLEQKGYYVQIPLMPETSLPKLNLWLPKLIEVIGKPDDELILIGHSSGCITIMRYLEQLRADVQIAGAIFVAGFTTDLGFDELKNFFTTPIEFEKIKTKAKKFVAINSDNDPYVPLEYADILEEKLGAEKIIMHNMKHFSGAVDGEESCTSLPVVSESVEKISGGDLKK